MCKKWYENIFFSIYAAYVKKTHLENFIDNVNENIRRNSSSFLISPLEALINKTVLLSVVFSMHMPNAGLGKILKNLIRITNHIFILFEKRINFFNDIKI